MEIKQVTIRLQYKDWEKLRLYTIKNNTSIQKILEDHVKEVIKEEKED